MTDADDPIDYLRMARIVVHSRFRLPAHMIDEAVSEAAFVGWKASIRHDPDDGMTLKGWVWMKMHHGVQDWLRSRFGRTGNKLNVAAPISYDLPVLADDEDGPRLQEILADPRSERGYEEIEARETLHQMIALACLTEKEQYVIDGVLADRTLIDLGDDLGVSESRACQIKLGAFKKMRAVAGVA